MLLTFLVSKLLKSIDCKEEHSLNILRIFCTLEVLKLLPKFIDSKEVHLLNIKSIYNALGEIIWLKSTDFKEIHSLNI